MYRSIVILILVPIFCNLSVWGIDNAYELANLSTDSLVGKGQKEVENSNFEEALVCFAIAAKRYGANAGEDEKFQTMLANIGQWYIYFFAYYDHVNAFKALSAALEISKEIGHSYSRIMLNYGCMYQTLAEQSEDDALLIKAWDYYMQSFKIGLEKDKDLSTLNMAFSNLVQVSVILNRTDELVPLWKDFLDRNAKFKTDSPSFSFDSIFYGAMLKMQHRDFVGAIAELDGEEIRSIVSQNGMGRYDIVRRMNLAKAYIELTGKYSQGIACMLETELVADSIGMKDANLEVYKYLRDLYAQDGQKENSLEYQYKYLSLKDSVLNYRSGAAISELTYLKKVEDVEKSLSEIDNHRRLQMKFIWIAVAIIFLALILLIMLKRHNRRLKILNETLYRNNILLIEKEESIRKKFEEMSVDGAKNVENEKNKPEKYLHSDITEEEKEEIYRSIMNVMLNSHEVFKPDFSSARLSDLTGYTYRHLSQVINEKTGDNFNALVNDTRIKEACRHMQPNGKFSGLTIEAIANNVGFRSRTSFIAAFKKFTGLTPSKYQNIANESQSGRMC